MNTGRGMISRSLFIRCALGALYFLGMPVMALAGTLQEVKERASVRCGVNPDLTGFSRANSMGEYSGFDVDLCRAVAAAVLGDANRVEFVPVSATDRFDDLVAKKYDVLSRNTTWTLQRDVAYGQFVGTTYYDGQGFMVPKISGVRSALELDNVGICISRGTTTELNAIDFFKVSQIRYKPVYFDDEPDAAQAYHRGECGSLTGDRSALAGQRAGFEEPDAHRILPEVISKEPLGPMVASNDEEWENVVRWTVNCLGNAEELGIEQLNVEASAEQGTPEVLRVLGVEGSTGESLGLDKLWCATVIAEVGNYGEIYERNVGVDTDLGLDRGVNTLWTDGGLIFAPPMR